MTREAEATTLQPLRFALGSMVTQEDLQKLIKQANWTYANRPMLHVSKSCGPAGWTTDAPALHGIEFRTGAGAVEVFQGDVYILPETTKIIVGAACSFPSGETGNVTIDIGGGGATLSHADADNDTELRDEVLTSSTGTGWLKFIVELTRTAGTGTATLLRFRIQDKVPESLPAPVLEPLGE